MSEINQESEARYWRALVENSLDIILVVDKEGSILFINRMRPPFERRAVVGAKVWEFAKEGAEERIRVVLRQVTESRSAQRYEAPGFAADGGTAWFEVLIVPVLFDGVVDRVVWTATDITARKRLEEQLQHSQKMEAVGLLAGGVAHDFNNLLAIIIGHAELATRKVGGGYRVGEEMQELQEIGAAAQRGAALTRKLLAFSRKQIIQPQAVDVRVAVHDFVEMLRRVVGADVEIEVLAGDAPHGTIARADPTQLEQILLNLGTNARQAMPDGGRLRLETRSVTLDEGFARAHPWARPGVFVELAVSDTGTGMDRTTSARVFEPFFTTKKEGTGLGLATVYGIVKQHGGLIHFETVLGSGTTFRVYLPVQSPASHRASAEARGAAPPYPGGTESILLAEDDASLRTLVAGTLSSLGYNVTASGDGMAALGDFEARPDAFALVILDVVMPRLGGVEAFERMRAMRPGLKVLFTSGYAPESKRLEEILSRSDIKLLDKPFTLHALAVAVRRALDGSASPEA